jgi:hypothetical protein
MEDVMSYYYDWKAAGGPARLEAEDSVIDGLIRTNGDRFRRSPPLRAVLWDMLAEGGPAQVVLHGSDARDALARSPDRYARELPAGTKPGPRVGPNRIIRS